jgi:hypothetical protein
MATSWQITCAGIHYVFTCISEANAVPAWAIVVIVSCSMIIVGGIMYVIMKKIILGSDSSSSDGAVPIPYRSDDEV